jgi:hypothetical protein
MPPGSRQKTLDRLSQEAAILWEAFQQAEARWEQIARRAAHHRIRAPGRPRASGLRARLDARAVEAYMEGGHRPRVPLGASSLAELSDRVEFVDALTQTDADLANDVENLRNELAAQEASQQRLRRRPRRRSRWSRPRRRCSTRRWRSNRRSWTS